MRRFVIISPEAPLSYTQLPGFYLISDGAGSPYRYRIRPPSFINLTVLEDMCLGHNVADAILILGSVDIVLGEVDR